MFSLQAKASADACTEKWSWKIVLRRSPIQYVSSQRASTLCNRALCRDLTVQQGWDSSRLGGDGNGAGRNEGSSKTEDMSYSCLNRCHLPRDLASFFLEKRHFTLKKNFPLTPSERISQEKQQVKFCSEWSCFPLCILDIAAVSLLSSARTCPAAPGPPFL